MLTLFRRPPNRTGSSIPSAARLTALSPWIASKRVWSMSASSVWVQRCASAREASACAASANRLSVKRSPSPQSIST